MRLISSSKTDAQSTKRQLFNPQNTMAITTALLPEPKGAFLGQLEKGSKKFDTVASEAARTVPGREHGG